MAAKPKKNLGKMPCPCCVMPVALMQAESGTLSWKCQEADCEATGFAGSHTSAAKKWLDALGTRQAPPEPAPKAPAAPAPKAPASSAPPAPEPQPPKKGGFSFPGL